MKIVIGFMAYICKIKSMQGPIPYSWRLSVWPHQQDQFILSSHLFKPSTYSAARIQRIVDLGKGFTILRIRLQLPQYQLYSP